MDQMCFSTLLEFRVLPQPLHRRRAEAWAGDARLKRAVLRWKLHTILIVSAYSLISPCRRPVHMPRPERTSDAGHRGRGGRDI